MKKILFFLMFFNLFVVVAQQKEESSYALIDSISLRAFWYDFKSNLKSNNKQAVIDVFKYPIPANHFVIFKYSYDCDTLGLIENEEEYGNLYFDRDNIIEYYDFIFSDILKEIIYQTSVNDLLKKGLRFKENPGMTYRFFPKDYQVKVNCINDHNLRFHISYEKGYWNIEVGSL